MFFESPFSSLEFAFAGSSSLTRAASPSSQPEAKGASAAKAKGACARCRGDSARHSLRLKRPRRLHEKIRTRGAIENWQSICVGEAERGEAETEPPRKPALPRAEEMSNLGDDIEAACSYLLP